MIYVGRYKPWGVFDTGNSKAQIAKNLGFKEDELEWEEYDERDWILLQVPKEFHGPLSWLAYSQGHSAGELEVLSVLRELVENLLPAIKDFEKRVLSEK